MVVGYKYYNTYLIFLQRRDQHLLEPALLYAIKKRLRRDAGITAQPTKLKNFYSSFFIVWVLFNLFAVLPETGHVFECLALGLWNQTPHKPCCEDTHEAIEKIYKHVAELVAH